MPGGERKNQKWEGERPREPKHLWRAAEIRAREDARPPKRATKLPAIAKFLTTVACACFCGSAALAADTAPDPLGWPPATQDCRPWSYWWWLGSAVDKENLTKELTRYRDAGWGGVHIIPIYGAKGW